MAVTSKPIGAEAEREGWTIDTVPIDARELGPLAAVLRFLAGLMMIAYSVITTTIVIGWVLLPLITTRYYGVPVAYVIGFLFGLGITVGEWATADNPLVHWFLVLVLDAPFSAWQTFIWLGIIIVARGGGLSTETQIILAVVSLAWGILTAKFGELLLVGKRRARR